MITRAVRFTLLEPLSIATGVPGLLSDDTVVTVTDPSTSRQVRGIPAPTIKGAARAVAASAWAGIDDETLGSLFGRAGRTPGRAIFGDAVPLPGLEPVVDEVTQVALTEQRTAEARALRTFEVLQPLARDHAGDLTPLVLEANVRVLGDDDLSEHSRALAVALAGIRSLGGGRSRGHGAVTVALAPEERS